MQLLSCPVKTICSIIAWMGLFCVEDQNAWKSPIRKTLSHTGINVLVEFVITVPPFPSKQSNLAFFAMILPDIRLRTYSSSKVCDLCLYLVVNLERIFHGFLNRIRVDFVSAGNHTYATSLPFSCTTCSTLDPAMHSTRDGALSD